MYLQPVVRCKNPDCPMPSAARIRLPYPNPPKTGATPPDWPQDGWRLRLICRECDHWYVYEKDDVLWAPYSSFSASNWSAPNRAANPEPAGMCWTTASCQRANCLSSSCAPTRWWFARTAIHFRFLELPPAPCKEWIRSNRHRGCFSNDRILPQRLSAVDSELAARA